jgi:hypothetical protein
MQTVEALDLPLPLSWILLKTAIALKTGKDKQ